MLFTCLLEYEVQFGEAAKVIIDFLLHCVSGGREAPHNGGHGLEEKIVIVIRTQGSLRNVSGSGQYSRFQTDLAAIIVLQFGL